MNEKPVNVRVAEATGAVCELRRGRQGPQWFEVRNPGEWVLDIPNYEHDAGAAFGALEAWRKMAPGRTYEISSPDDEYKSFYCLLSDGETGWQEFGESLPAAICQAIIAAGEKEAGR